MTTLSLSTTVALCVLCLVVAFAYPLWPALAVTFEAGLLTGALVRAGHTRTTQRAHDRNG